MTLENGNLFIFNTAKLIVIKYYDTATWPRSFASSQVGIGALPDAVINMEPESAFTFGVICAQTPRIHKTGIHGLRKI